MFAFIESAAFERVRPFYLDDDEYAELQQFMLRNPEAGNVSRALVVLGNCAGGARAAASGEG